MYIDMDGWFTSLNDIKPVNQYSQALHANEINASQINQSFNNQSNQRESQDTNQLKSIKSNHKK